MAGRALQPATPEDAAHVEQVVLCLRVARHHARLAGCTATLSKIRRALKSAEGARRHVARRIEWAANGAVAERSDE
jgi:hypothetical protein